MSCHGICSDIFRESGAHRSGEGSKCWIQKMLVTVLTRGRSGSVGSVWADEVALRLFLCNESTDVPFGVANVCDVPFFLFFDIAAVDIVDNRSLVVTLEASDRESSRLRGRPNCDGGIGKDTDTKVLCRLYCGVSCKQLHRYVFSQSQAYKR